MLLGRKQRRFARVTVESWYGLVHKHGKKLWKLNRQVCRVVVREWPKKKAATMNFCGENFR